jgi:hypothetical protein
MRAAPKYTISTSGRHTIATLNGHYHRPAISQEKAQRVSDLLAPTATGVSPD